MSAIALRSPPTSAVITSGACAYESATPARGFHAPRAQGLGTAKKGSPAGVGS